MTARIIVFRFDRNPLVCRSRIAALRARNPGVLIVGLYGGRAGLRRMAFRLGSRLILGLDSFYASPHAGIWNWKNGDLALVAWFRDAGHRLAFDVAHFVEWDLLLAESLATLYRNVPPDGVGVTCLTPVSEVGDEWPWLKREQDRAEYEQLLESVAQHVQRPTQRFASIGVGPCFPRSFLADYAEAEVPELAHDELRVPLYAQVLGYQLVDTALRTSWADDAEDEIFNASGRAIDPARVVRELSRPDGRRAFHPVREVVRGVG